MEEVVTREPLRPIIAWSVAICLGAAMAPWLSGGQEPLAALISGFALLMGSVLLWQQPSVRRLKVGPMMYGYLAFVAWGSLSLIWTANRYSTLMWVIGLLLAGLAFRLAYALSGEEDSLWRIEWVYLATALGFVAYGGYLYLSGGYDRLTGSFYWPNPAAAYLIPGILIAFDRWRRGGRWWNGAMTAVFGAAFLLTDSRAALATLAVAAVIYVIVIRLTKRFWIIFVFSVAASLGVAYGMVALRHALQPKAVISVPGSRLSPASAVNSQSGADRVTYLHSAVLIWADHPILGAGAGAYPDVHPHYQIRVISASASAHNIYVQTLAELGLVGILLMIWLMVCLVFGTVRGLVARPLGMAATLGVGAIWLHFGLDIDAQYPALVLLIAVFGGSLYHQRLSFKPLGWWLPLGSVVVLIPIVALYYSDTWNNRGVAAQANGDYAIATNDFLHAHGYIFYNPDVLTAQGINEYTLAQLGNKAAGNTALLLARSAEKQDPNDGQHYQLEGRTLALMGDRAGAIKAYEAALQADPYNHPEYAYDLALVQSQIGQSAAGLVAADTMLAQYPTAVVVNRSADPSLRANLAQLAALAGSIRLQNGDLAGARKASAAALAFDPTSLRAQALAAVLARVPVGAQ
ncbi:O-antigen ligase family protein [Candidatus Saccharibacteria bacterium]|nr:O-antigen ligase family protein [Candidatus Saccharibacteria bacterium]